MSVGHRGGLQGAETDVIYEAVRANYTLPLEGYPFQIETVNELGHLPRAGYYLDPGTGKTFCATASALYKRDTRKSQTIVALPPILLDGWAKFLNRIQASASPSTEAPPLSAMGWYWVPTSS